MSTKYTIEFVESVFEDLKELKVFDRAKVLEEIDKQLVDQPSTATRRRKIIEGLVPPWEHTPPVWQLRVEDYRIFYEVDEESKVVTVRAIRLQPPHSTTEEII